MAAKSLCLVEGCDQCRESKDWCNKHYKRWKRHGDPLAGRRPPAKAGEPQRYFSEIVCTYEGDDCLIWPFSRSGGYGQMGTSGASNVVSRLVCEHVNGPPPTPIHQASHKCGNGHKGCVSPRHLRWATAKENQMDRLVHGTARYGEKQSTKLSEKNVREIRLLRGSLSLRQIAERFGVSPQTVSRIHLGHLWGRLT